MLDDPRISNPLTRLQQLCEYAELLNHPLKSHDGVGGGGKPGSRTPGDQQCEYAIRRLQGILHKAVADASATVAHAQPKERTAEPVHSIGGVKVIHEIQVRQGQLVAKVVRHDA